VGSTEPAFSLTIDRTPDGLLQVAEFVDRAAAALNLEQRAEYALRLCLEEAVANLVMHGQPGPDNAPDTVALRLSTQPKRLIAAIEDHCAPFDPRDTSAPQQAADIAHAQIGGLGIHLMKQFAKAMQYDRIDKTNRLTVTIETG
jgi:anti-sigma regulatory factor (Ser/Thr protein kinase)